MKQIILGLLLASVLGSCAGSQPAPQALVLAPTPTRSANRAVQTLPSPPPTATAAVFHLKPSSTPLPSPTPVATDFSYAYGPLNFPPYINPLTGLEVEHLAVLERRPLAIKVTNFPRSVRPQWGLTLADHVYEYYLEDGLTRFIAIFYGNDATRVGPVRSARLFDEHVLRMYKAVLAFGYADDRVVKPWEQSDLRNLLVIERPDNCPPLCRIGPKTDYNTLYADTQKLSEYITGRGTSNNRQDLEGLRFEFISPAGGFDAPALSIRYSRSSYHRWEYDPATRRYLRQQESQFGDEAEAYMPLMDSLTEQQIAADNVVVLLVAYSYFYKSNSTEIYQIGLVDEGSGYALRDGRMSAITWKRHGTDRLISLYYPQGRPYGLKPGNVWFEVIGTSSRMEQYSDGTWRFNFDIP